MFRKFIIIILIIISERNEIFANDFEYDLPTRDSLLPKIALVLSGGGARGLAQIGVLKGMQESGVSIDYIVGTSIGAIIGGMYACGHSPSELEKALKGADWKNATSILNSKLRSQLFFDQKEIYDRSLLTFKFNNFTFIVPEAANEGTTFDRLLQNLIWSGTYQSNNEFDKLKVPFRAIATDLVTGKVISLSSGNLSKAIRASATIPLRYTPIKIDSLILVDGGILANLPVKQALEFKPDLIIAINTTSPLHQSKNLNSAIVIADQVISIAMEKFTNDNSKIADLVITPPLSYFENDNFDEIDSLIKIGYVEFKNIKNNLLELITSKINSKISKIFENYNFNHSNEIKEIHFIGFTENQRTYLEQLYPKIDNNNDYSRLILSLYLLENNYYSGFKIKKDNNILSIYAKQYPLIKSIQVDLPEKLRGNIDLLSNYFLDEPFNNNIKKDIGESYVKYLHYAGYEFASLSSIKEDKGNLEIELNLGVIDSIIYKFPSSINNFLVDRELTFKIGDTATINYFLSSLDNLNSAMLFKNVEIIPIVNKNNGLNVIISLEESSNQTIRIGARYDNERKTQIGIDLIQENFNFLGSRVALRGVFATNYLKSSLSFDNTRIFGSKFSSSLNLYYNEKELYEYFNKQNNNHIYGKDRAYNYDEQRYGLKFLLGTQLDKSGRLFSELRHEYQRYYRLQDTIIPDYKSYTTLKFGFIIDNQETTNFPQSGQFIDLSLESSVFSDNRVDKFSIAKFYYHNNIKIGDVIFRPSLMFGIADITLPFMEFFSLGGEDSFFGLREEEERGRQIFKGSINYYYKIPIEILFDTYFYGRYDIGAIWLQPREIKLSNLKNGFGMGLAFDTPLGPARFSVGKSWYYTKSSRVVEWGPMEFYIVVGINL